MACEVIDLDKYEFSNDILNLDSCDAAAKDYLVDYRTIDAEIIDYGICEDQYEDHKEIIPKTNITPCPEKTQCKPPLSASNTPNICQTKAVSVKVVDCNKYPWYYTKYKKQIIDKKYLNAIDHARNILNGLKSSINEETTSVNKIVYTDDVHKIQFKDSKKVHKTNTENKISSTTVDLKKNIGLVGMKVQKLNNDKYKEYCINKKKMVKKPKIKTYTHLDNDKKIGQYKPMPKSKKLALQNQISKNFSLHSPNKNTEELRICMKNPTTLLITKHSTSKTASSHTKKDKTRNKSFTAANKFTEKVLKAAKNNMKKDAKLKKEDKSMIKNEEESHGLKDVRKNTHTKPTATPNVTKPDNIKSHVDKSKIINEKEDVRRRGTKKINEIHNNFASSHGLRDARKNTHIKPTATPNVTKPDKPHVDPVLLNKSTNSSLSSHKIQAVINRLQNNTTPTLTNNIEKTINNLTTKTVNNVARTTVNNLTRTSVNNLTKTDAELHRNENSNFVPGFQAGLTNNTSNQTTSAVTVNTNLMKTEPFIEDEVKESGTNINSTSVDKDYVQNNKTIKLTAPSINSLSQEPPLPQEYVVPDLIHTSIESPANCRKPLSIAIPDSIPRSQLHPAYGQYANTIHFNSNIPNANNVERNRQAILKTYQIPVLTRAAPNPNVVIRPNIIRKDNPQYLKPYWDAKFQQSSSMMTPESAVQPSKQYPWRYIQPNYVYPQADMLRMPWNMQQIGVNPNYPNQPVYNRENIPAMQYPPGTSNVQPNGYHISPYNSFNPYPLIQAPQPYPHQHASNGENSSVIGRNTTGLVKKINITSNPVTASLEKQSKEDTLEKAMKITVDNSPAASTKLAMMEELQKSFLSDVEDSVDTESERKEITNKTEIHKLATQKSLPEKDEKYPKQQLTNTTEVDFNKQPLKPYEDAILQRNSSKLVDPKEPLTNINTAYKRPILNNMNKGFKNYSNGYIYDVGYQPEDAYNYKFNKPGPLSKKFKPNDALTASTQSANLVPVKRYSPPILPIPTYQNILSQIEIAPSTDRFGKSAHAKIKKINNNILKNRPNKMNMGAKFSKNKETAKKISLVEYMRRSLIQNGKN